MKIARALLLPLALLSSLPVSADNLFGAVTVSDAELSQMRGRYAMPSGIVSFGVIMQSQWNAPQGQLNAKVSLHFQQKSILPVINVDLQQSGQGQAPSGPNHQISGGAGLNSAQGVLQSVRIAGDGNRGLNDVQINILRGASASPQLGSGNASLNQTLQGAIGQARVIAKNGGLQIDLDAGDLGRTQHRIGSGGIRQNSEIRGQNQVVSNLAALQVVLKERGPVNNQALQGALGQLRGLRANGF
ncbi:MAG: hypothetical protein LPK18_08405 [Pseudomonadaceae bacterium]|nr:hypothetical protein [Pseudomonadaceae bacterium]